MTGYEKYSREIEEVTNKINLKTAVGTARKGGAKARDRIVFGKLSWTEALSFVTIIQSVVIFTALIPDAVVSVNTFLDYFGIPFHFPVEISSVGAVVFIIVVFIFGLVAVRHIGTYKRSNELTSKMNPGTYLIWEKIEKLEKKLEDKK